jgi:hypothetical protein
MPPGNTIEQAFRQGRQDEAALLLGEDADACQRPQQSVKRPRVRPGGFGKVLRRPGTVLEKFGDAQLGGDVNRLRVPVAAGEAGQLVMKIGAHGLKLRGADEECKEGAAWRKPPREEG